MVTRLPQPRYTTVDPARVQTFRSLRGETLPAPFQQAHPTFQSEAIRAGRPTNLCHNDLGNSDRWNADGVILVSEQSANALANDNRVRTVYPIMKTKSPGYGITADDRGYSACVSGMPRSFASSPAALPPRSVLQ
jgi:hypothetical protein